MTLLPYAVLLYIPFVYASLSSLNGTIATTFNVSDSSPSCGTRTLWSVIWSCAATLFACTWTAIHPNIPGMDEGKVIVFCRRLCIMIMALVAPELMITWAANQFLSARDTAKAFNDAFGAQPHQARSDNPDIGESAATLLSEIPSSDGRNSPHPSAPHVADFEGQSPARPFGAVNNVIKRMSHRLDGDAGVFHMDGWIHAPL